VDRPSAPECAGRCAQDRSADVGGTKRVGITFSASATPWLAPAVAREQFNSTQIIPAPSLSRKGDIPCSSF
jgi:ABC-type antimicrobial peptide transport system permease subunit